MKKITILFAFCCFSSSFLFSQTTAIPDSNFEQALIDLGIDTNGLNGNILNADAESATSVIVGNKSISDLTGIEAFINITELHCQQNPLGSLDISNNTALTTLVCFTNQLPNLDVTQNIALETLRCNSNNLSSLDLSQNTALGTLNCAGNNLSSLDLSQNIVLDDIFCQINQLTSLDVRNGNNTNINTASFNAGNNPNLLCIDVDDVVYAAANWSTVVDPQTSFSIECDALNVFVPDDNFEQTLIDLGIDIGGPVLDDFALILNINSITSLDVSSKNIFDFTGINQFVALEDLNVSINPITNSITFDVSTLTTLKTLTCAFNQLTSLDISNNTALENLNYNNNSLSNVDLSNNTALIVLRNKSNSITSLDVSNQPLLEDLRCENNQLNSLDVSSNLVLAKLFVLGNQLTSLDVSNNPQLIALNCVNNQLMSLDVRNGNNSNITTASFNTSNNPSLTCIDVDDITYATTNWTNIDAQTSFSLDCNAPTVTILDANFEQALIDLGIDTNGLNGNMLESDAIGVINITVINKNISDLTGIEIFADLEVLNCQQNNLTSLDLSQNIDLLNLSCFTNQLSSLNISQNTSLLTLFCAVNQLISLDVSNNTQLVTMSCFGNQLSSLDLTQNTMLTSLDCFSNQLTYLDVRNGNNTNMTNFTAYNNSALTCIFVDDAVYSTANWTNIDPNSTFVETEVACSTLGIDEVEQNINLVLYPNPVEDVLHIKVLNNLLISKVELFDVSGKRIITSSATDTLNVSQLHSGLYFVSITVDNNVVTKKLIIK